MHTGVSLLGSLLSGSLFSESVGSKMVGVAAVGGSGSYSPRLSAGLAESQYQTQDLFHLHIC